MVYTTQLTSNDGANIRPWQPFFVKKFTDISARCICYWAPRTDKDRVIHWQLKYRNSSCPDHSYAGSISVVTPSVAAAIISQGRKRSVQTAAAGHK